jgi:pSer/pThr/pTyr-binding forkhead associated (FHA) protein
MHVRLKVLQGSHAGKELPVPAPKFVIGRGDDCQLRPQSDAVSRRHCEIMITENEVVVRDLGSRNGTFVNGERVGEVAVLLAGDQLRIGPLEFEMVVEQTVAKPKRPKVADIKEAVARTAEGSSVGAASELSDVTQWLEEADTEDIQRRHVTPETRQFRLDDTAAPTEAVAKAAAAHDTKSLPPDLKLPDKKKTPGKLPPHPKTSKENSREAAADMLKKFFNRR